MASLNALRAALRLAPVSPGGEFQTVEAALEALPRLPAALVRVAALRLLAQDMTRFPAATSLLHSLHATLGSAKPERELVQWLAQLTGGRAELRASWGEVVASSASDETGGDPSGSVTRLEQRLSYEGRHLGSLSLRAHGEWHALFALVAEFAKLARLQSAAAGASRRRSGERVLEALLVGDVTGAPDSEPCTLAALRFAQPTPRSERSRESYMQALDVLCGVGEGYFQGRGLKCYATVRGDKALWLWHSADPEREAAGLLKAVLSATDQDVRLGSSQRQDSYASLSDALRQATQALSEARLPRTLVPFARIDPLHTLLSSPAVALIGEQLRGRLAAEDASGKLEETLRRYLGYSGPLSALADEMHIHVNTLRYRLGRLEEVLGGQLSEPAFLARLYLGLEAHSGP